MSLILQQSLTIGAITFPYVRAVKLESSREAAADKLTITIPRYSNLKKDQIKKGDSVTWSAGYKSTGVVPEFDGKVETISSNAPLEIIAYDPMRELMFKQMKRNYYNKPLDMIMADMGVADFEIRDNPGRVSLRCYGRSARWALSLLKNYGLYAYYQAGVLIIDTDEYPTDSGNVFQFQHSIIDSDELGITEEKPMKITVRCEVAKTGVIRQASYGTGEPSEIIDVEEMSSSSLYKKAKEIYQEKIGAQFTGSFTTFGYPSTRHSELIKIVDRDEPNRTRTTLVSAIEKTFDSQQASYRQKIYPGRWL